MIKIPKLFNKIEQIELVIAEERTTTNKIFWSNPVISETDED